MFINKLPLEPGEIVISVYRKHWFVYFFDTILIFVLLVAPYVAYAWMANLDIVSVNINTHLATILYFSWFLLLWGYFFIVWTNQYLDAWIVTDKRIIDIEQVSLFHRNVSDFRIEKIQNITVRERGFIANMLGYGTIHVETAGEKVELLFDYIPNPYEVRDTISECHDKCLARLEQSPNPQARDIVTGD